MNKTEVSVVIWRKINFAYRIMLFMLFCMSIVTAICIRVYPTTHTIKLLLFSTLLFGVFTAFVALIGICHNRPKMLYPLLFFTAFIFVWMLLGSKEPDPNGLRRIYVARLMAHEDVKYMPGGETDHGVDSAGLAKSSLWQAMIIEGLREFNPRLFGKEMLDLWFTSLSNQDLLYGKHGYTHIIDHPTTLVGYSSFLLDSGDMAITRDAKNLMVYIGNGSWILSDKTLGKVQIIHSVTGKSVPNEFRDSVIIVRWWLLSSESPAKKNN